MSPFSPPRTAADLRKYVRAQEAQFENGEQFWFAIGDHTVVWCILLTVSAPITFEGQIPITFQRWYLHWDRYPVGFTVVRGSPSMSSEQRSEWIRLATARVAGALQAPEPLTAGTHREARELLALCGGLIMHTAGIDQLRRITPPSVITGDDVRKSSVDQIFGRLNRVYDLLGRVPPLAPSLAEVMNQFLEWRTIGEQKSPRATLEAIHSLGIALDLVTPATRAAETPSPAPAGAGFASRLLETPVAKKVQLHLHAYGAADTRLLAEVARFIAELESYPPNTVGLAASLHLLGLRRLLDAFVSTKLLAERGLAIDAATIASSAYELAYTLAYVDANADLCQKWIEHSKPGDEPFPVAEAIAGGFENSKFGINRETALFLYSKLCGCKHGGSDDLFAIYGVFSIDAPFITVRPFQEAAPKVANACVWALAVTRSSLVLGTICSGRLVGYPRLEALMEELFRMHRELDVRLRESADPDSPERMDPSQLVGLLPDAITAWEATKTAKGKRRRVEKKKPRGESQAD